MRDPIDPNGDGGMGDRGTWGDPNGNGGTYGDAAEWGQWGHHKWGQTFMNGDIVNEDSGGAP